jgi:hypothetical protein
MSKLKNPAMPVSHAQNMQQSKLVYASQSIHLDLVIVAKHVRTP